MTSNAQTFEFAFLRRISRRRPTAQRCIDSIPEYVETRAALLGPEHLEKLLRELPLLRVQFAAIVAPEFPHLVAQLRMLSQFFEDASNDAFKGVSSAARKETALALRYTANNTDIIADDAADIGYSDDSIIVRTVLQRHQDLLREYCAFRKISWSKITLSP